jgi:hypothetical protein
MDNRQNPQIVTKYVALVLAFLAAAVAANATLVLLLYEGDKPDIALILAYTVGAFAAGTISAWLFVIINRKAPTISYLFVLGMLLFAFAASKVKIHFMANEP